MIDYRCPDCGKLFFRAESALPVRVETKCRGCKRIVEPAPLVSRDVLHRTYRCSRCDRVQHVERPTHDRSYCLVCGTQTLTIVAEKASETQEVPARTRERCASSSR